MKTPPAGCEICADERQWSSAEEVLPGVALVEAGGHFPGAAVAHYPNQIPLSAGLVRRSADRYIAWAGGANDHLG